MLLQRRKLWLSAAVALLACLTSLGAQTTASLYGSVADDKGEALPGATVIATHTPSGTRYGTVTRENGLFAIQNMRVGGPYTVSVTFSGFQDGSLSDVYLSLNQKFVHHFALATRATTLVEAVVTDSKYDIFRSNRTGAETNIRGEQIALIPNLNRSQSGLTKLNPMAGDDGSFAGRNDQFNGFTLDGTIFNNPFGLDASTPGGQTDAQPISLDAIDQVSVSIAPYDVTQAGFTGAAVNAVTKSGTNEWHGSVYTFYRNKNMLGDKVDGTTVPRGDLEQTQTGASLGGPIAKDMAFIFMNYEQSRASDFGSYFVANRGQQGGNVSRVLASDMELVSKLLADRYGYRTGAYENFTHKTNSDKFLIKVDYNVSEKHKFTFTANALSSFKDKPAHPSAIGRRGPDAQTLQFENSGYRINNRILNGIAELKSIWGSDWANKFQIGETYFTDFRQPKSSPFPVLNISKAGTRYIVAGHEPFSIHNNLNQHVFQVNDNLNYYTGKQTWTFGGSLEKFKFDNSFNLTGYGARVFFPDVPIEDFETFINSGALDSEVASAIAADAANATGPHEFGNWALAETNVGQLAGYIQDEIAATNRLDLTFGVRVDMPLYFDTDLKAQENIGRNCCYDPSIWYYKGNAQPVQLSTTEMPKQRPLWSPRFGFNYALNSSRKSVLRGGSGLFTGRFPFVWVGNQVANPNSFFYCATDPDFKYPQVWRSNLGLDTKIMGWTASADVIYTKDVNAMMVRNYGLRNPTGTLNGDGDNRPVYTAFNKGANTAYVFSNTNVGESWNAGLQIERSYRQGYYVKLGYNYLDARDASSIDAEISSDAYDRNPANLQGTNTANLAPSLYGNKHRVLALLSKTFNYGKNNRFGTTVSVFTEWVRGGRYSYTYSGDINNDGSGLNDLLYVPTDAQIDNMIFVGATDAAAQKSAFKAYIAQDKYLSGLRGKYTEKYAALSPWYNHWDLRVAEDLGLWKKHKIQLTADIINIGNLISDKFGVRQYATYTGLAQPLAYSGTDASTGKPTYQFDTAQTKTFFNDFSLLSRWQLQVGARLSF